MTTPTNPSPRNRADLNIHRAEFYQIRERAHHERTRAINSAVSAVWNAMTGWRARHDRDAGFWNA